MQTRPITLGDREYEIAELPAKANAKWRRELEQSLAPLLDTLEHAREFKIEQAGDLTKLIGNLRHIIFRSPETLTDLLFAYSDALRRDRKRIEAEAYESELLAAFVHVLQLAYPFGGLFRMADRLNQIANGSEPTPDPQTLTNSASPPGAIPPG